MKKYLKRIFLIIVSVLTIIVTITILKPFEFVDVKQAQRIAKWKTEYDKLEYIFNLVKLHEGIIIPQTQADGEELSDEYIFNRLKPYLNLEYSLPTSVLNYSYRKMNGSKIKKENQFYFNKFATTKTGNLISVRKNQLARDYNEDAQYYLFIDINGNKKPNRIGKDIFFVNIYKDYITPLGEGKSNSKVKISCSPIGNGLYCSESYLLGGHL